MTACQAMGDPYTEIRAELAEERRANVGWKARASRPEARPTVG